MDNPQNAADARAGNSVSIYPAAGGGWIYEVWMDAKPTIVGCCATRASAEREASIAQLRTSRP
jgi:hypothetical protein